jgi:N-carbamoyl-L-amino-acid hydrolase
MSELKIAVDQRRLQSEIDELSLITEAEPPVVTRVVFSSADLRARRWLALKCREAHLRIRTDAVGNMFAHWQGTDPTAPAVGTGSHIDAIPNAGKFDGVVGVLGGLEAIRALQSANFHPKSSIELLVFTSEEPTRFGVGCLGSRLLSGTLSPQAASELRDDGGDSLDKVRRAANFSGELASVKLPSGYYKAFVELHIEQGPVLEQNNIPLGLVRKIAAPASAKILVEGSGGHAGGVLMPDRKDALCTAAELVLAVESAARETEAPDTVATVGICEVFPGAVNSIPSRVRLSLDVRDTDLVRRDSVMQKIAEATNNVASKRAVSIRTDLLNADSPADCSPLVTRALAEACRAHSFPFLDMVSRAYHDSLFMSRIAPTGMLFIPCRNGWSHRPDEFASPEDIARGALILAEALARLAA